MLYFSERHKNRANRPNFLKTVPAIVFSVCATGIVAAGMHENVCRGFDEGETPEYASQQRRESAKGVRETFCRAGLHSFRVDIAPVTTMGPPPYISPEDYAARLGIDLGNPARGRDTMQEVAARRFPEENQFAKAPANDLPIEEELTEARVEKGGDELIAPNDPTI